VLIVAAGDCETLKEIGVSKLDHDVIWDVHAVNHVMKILSKKKQ
jgi:hypothetical protein